MTRPTIAGTTIDLEPLARKHISDAYVGWFNDPEVTRYNAHGERLATREWVSEYVDRITTSDTDAVFAIIAKDTGLHIGNIALQKIDAHSSAAEYAIIVGNKDYWGKGVAAEASRLLIAWGFASLGLHRVYCGTSAANVPMQKLAERLGFVREGVRRQAMRKRGAFVDIVEYGLLREEFTP